MSINNAEQENWPQNCDNFLSKKNIYFSKSLFLCNIERPKTSNTLSDNIDHVKWTGRIHPGGVGTTL